MCEVGGGVRAKNLVNKLIINSKIYLIMKSKFRNPISLLFLTAFLFSSPSCIEDDEGVCEVSYYADLVLGIFGSVLDKITEENGEVKKYYNIGNTVINFIDDVFECQANVTTAGENQFYQKIYYQENINSSPLLIDEIGMSINQLSPGEKAAVTDYLAFGVDGYYTFHHFADYTDLVTERREDNNFSENPLGRNAGGDDAVSVVKVTGTKKKPRKDANGNDIYFERVSTAVVYE